MSLATCSRFFRPCLSRIRPALSSPSSVGCRLYSCFEKRPNFAVSRLLVRHASGSGQSSGAFLGDNGMLVVGIGLLGGSLFYVSIILIFFLSVKKENKKKKMSLSYLTKEKYCFDVVSNLPIHLF